MLHLLGYIDPGTGAMVLQVVVATVLSAGFMFRRILISPVARFFGRFRKSDNQPDAVGTGE